MQTAATEMTYADLDKFIALANERRKRLPEGSPERRRMLRIMLDLDEMQAEIAG